MKSSLTCLLLFFFLLTGKAQTRQEVSYFPLQDVKLLESPFLQAQQTDLHYIMARIRTNYSPLFCAKPGSPLKRQVIPIGKIPDWTGISADIIFPHSP